ncbi:MAG: hypothetical protein LUD69_07835 [Oscillospiraceae bacterium]|nr:hypothetical protein [Oscillospiraceae bacterium]
MLTDNEVLVRNFEPLPALMCVQRKAEKKVPTEEDFVESNLASFGNEIGQTTNRITAMYEIQSRCRKGDREYDELAYRIQCGQLYQQNSIDKAKGIICKPMPKTWYDRHAVNDIEDGNTREFYRSIVADKKPYFMRYVYPALMKQYNTYIKNTGRNAQREFQTTVEEMKSVPYGELKDDQKKFLHRYDYGMPVGVGDCVMNRICRRFEREFDGHIKKHNASSLFDYRILKSGCEYSEDQFREIRRLYDEYVAQLKRYKIFSAYEKVDGDISSAEFQVMNEAFRAACVTTCPNEATLCDTLLDLCYTRNATKRFVWEMCGSSIIQNLLNRNDRMISVPVRCEDGEFTYAGERYAVRQTKLDEVSG